jgi:hypothetical protein
VTVKDLFGDEVDLDAMWNAPMRSGGKKRKPTQKRGHAWKPGTGPEGETCGTCRHCVRKHLAKTYIKCGKNEAAWTGGTATDIRVKDAACKFWEKK